jgi:hypothetical protein
MRKPANSKQQESRSMESSFHGAEYSNSEYYEDTSSWYFFFFTLVEQKQAGVVVPSIGSNQGLLFLVASRNPVNSNISELS